MKSDWSVYIIRCADNSLYTGITTDLDRRMDEHNHKKTAAAYTRSRRPVVLVYRERYKTRSKASKREYEIRTLSKLEKEKLVKKQVKSEE